ncbi:UPF0430 protein CG31712-like [Mya arenaria]|uniref:UPF0430 protein CG31712-like n=1 Tax=Mya arenaria TaxID=6604 RepID=UPI0022E8DE0A|nr:UPF0430 protein CG31712-like [Mya arenaria]
MLQRRKKKGGGAAGKKLNALSKAARKAAVAKKLSKMTKKEKEQYRKGKRNSDSESEFSYRSYVSDGGTRHVARRRRHEDGTYSDEHSYHSSQDEDGEARRRRRRRDREHGADSAHSYYSVVSEGGTRTVRRRRKREDGTYSDSEAFNSDKAGTDSEGGRKGEDDGDYGLDRDDKNSEGESEDSDVSVYSEVSEGGTRHQMQRKRIRDADGNIVGYGEPEPHKPKKKTSNIGDVGSDRDKNEALGSLNQKRDGELLREVTTDSLKGLREDGEDLIPPNIDWPGRDAAEQEQKILQETEEHIPSDFSDATTEDDIDLSKLTPAQRRQYLAEKERRRKEREKRRREKYGDSYDEIMKKKNAKKHEELSKKLAEKEAEDKARKEAEERQGNGRDRMGSRRWSNASSLRGGGGRPKSMVTYDKAPPRGLSDTGAVDKREIGLAHDEYVIHFVIENNLEISVCY